MEFLGFLQVLQLFFLHTYHSYYMLSLWKPVQQTNSLAPEPEGSSPHSQQPANDPYPEPGESTPHTPNQSP
jgi:hypothetical protein